MSLREFYQHMIPDRTESHATSQDAIAAFLQDVEWPVKNKPFDDGNEENTIPLQQGVNLFVDSLPKWLYSQDRDHMSQPDIVLIHIVNEAVGGFPVPAKSKEHQFKTGVRISVLSGNLDVAKKEATLLYRFFLQREVGFTACGLQVRLIRAVDEPSLVGVDEDSLATYQFRLVMDVVREYPHNSPTVD